MLKFCCAITGDEYELLKNETPYSQKKIRLFALVISIPVIMWLVNSYLLTTEVLKKDALTGIIVMLICTVIIFIIEKSIVMSNGSRAITVFRILLGFIVAFIGSLSFDEVIFHNDIESQMSENKREYVALSINNYKAELNGRILESDKKVSEKDNLWQISEREAINEADGTGGTGIPNVGKITQLKLMKAEESKNVYEKSKLELNNLKNTTDSVLKVTEENIGKSYNENSLLLRIKALFDLVSKDGWMLVIYITFTFLVLFLESLVIIVKIFSKDSNYEKKMKLIEQLGEKRMKLLYENNSPVYDRIAFKGDLQKSTDLIDKPLNGIYN